jgi:hypothetical protein
MTPAETQEAVLNALEKLGGKPVVLQKDEKLSNKAKISLATAAQPVHVLTYHPAAVNELPYLVCFQCGLAERAIKTAADERFNVASTPNTYSQVENLVRGKNAIPENVVVSYTQMVADGLGTQLRSMPIGIRVDRAIFANHPELHEMQRTISHQQLQEEVACLSPTIRKMAPDLILNASVAMNAAHALALSRMWNDDACVVPYRLAGFESLGSQLLERMDSIPDSPTHDRELVTEWATLLGIADLFQIAPVGL